MKKFKPYTFILILLLFLPSWNLVTAQTFTDNFSNLDSWDIIRGDWRTDTQTVVGYWSIGVADNIGGIMQLKPATFSSESWTAEWQFIYMQDSINTNYYKATASLKNYIDIDNFFNVGIGAGDFNWPGVPQDSIGWSFAGMDGGVDYSAGSGHTDIYWDPHVWNTIKIIKIDSLFKLYLNGNFVTLKVDTVHSGVGQFALTTYGTVRHRNFSITTDVSPEAPFNFVATPANNQIDLSWDAPSDPTILYHKIYRSVYNDSLTTDSLDLVLSPGTGLSDNKIVPGVRYYYWLSAVDSNLAESTWAGPANAAGLDPLYAATELKLYPTGSNAGDNFGYSVNAFGNDMIIGGVYGDGAADSSGVAHIFTLSGSNWIEQTKLFASDGSSLDFFGLSVDISGEYAIVGALYQNSHTGAAYLFKRTGTIWNQAAKLTASDGAAGDEFGASVSIDGDWLIVGAEQDDDRGDGSGSAYIFHRNGDVWEEVQKITGSATSVNNFFGTCLEMYGDYVVIGAHRNGGESAYVFKKNNDLWLEHQILTTSEPGTNYFGFWVDIEQDIIAVGAINSNVNGISGSGSAFVFRRLGEIWTEEAMLVAPDADVQDYFGRVKILGDYIMCSSPFDDDHGSRSGSAYLYHYTGSDWETVVKLTPSDGATDDIYGTGYVLIKDYILIGSYWDDDYGDGSGAVYQYNLPQDITDDPVIIDNSIFSARFDHSRGMIDSLTFKSGSNLDLLSQSWNGTNQRGLGRLGELDDGNTWLTAINLYADSASLHYTSKNYGDKKFYMRWSATEGLEIDMVFNLTVEGLEGATWEPGGDNDSVDSLKIIKSNSATEIMPFTYPGGYQAMYYDLAWANASWDGGFDEVYGYAFKKLHNVAVGSGVSADGPFNTIPPGEDTIYFAIKPQVEYWNWVSIISGYQSIDFSMPLTITDNNLATTDVILGSDPSATDGYDAGLDIYAPPPPFPGAFDARFTKDGDDYLNDFRATNSSRTTWELEYQPSASGDPLVVTWDNTTLPPGRFNLVDVPTQGSMVNIDMKTESSFTDALGVYNLYIVYTLSEAFSEQVDWGWNMVGLPYSPVDPHYLVLFPNAVVSTLYGFNGAYYGEDTLTAGTGYWLRFPASEAIPVEGYPIHDLTLDLAEGWNMISGLSTDVAVTGISDPAGIIIPGTLFSFDGVYTAHDTLRLGKGYWIRTSAAGQTSMSTGGGTLPKIRILMPDITEFSSLRISDVRGREQTLYFGSALEKPEYMHSFSLPPLPPQGAFDARFAGDYRLTESDEAVIYLQAADYPLAVQLDNASYGDRYAYILEQVADKKVISSDVLESGSSIKVDNDAVSELRLRKTIIVPNEFVVFQNYPNPFNPTTSIKYGLPQAEQVDINIYNSLGQRVKSLLSKNQDAGYHTIVWDGTNNSGIRVSTGIYFYRIKSGTYQKIMKMVLLK